MGGNERMDQKPLDVDLDYVLELTKKLIKTSPVNPPGKEEGAALIVGEELEKLGADVKYDYVFEKRPNVIGIFKGKEDVNGVLLNGHLDVVPPGPGWSFEPFDPKVSEGKLYGRGAVDMLGGMAAMLGSVKAIVDSGVELKKNLVFTAVVDEECGGSGAEKVVKDGLRADYVVVGEPSNLKLIIAEKGLLWLKIKSKGKAAHGSTPHMGINAIEGMMRALELVRDMRYECEPHEILGSYTVNIGTIEGGTKTNIVPAECEATVDIRIIPGMDIEKIMGKVKDCLKGLSALLGCSYEVEAIQKASPFETDPDSDIVQTFREVFKEVIGKDAKLDGMSGATDGRFFAEKGIQTVIFGPGPIEKAHTSDEYVEIETLEKASKVIANSIVRLIGTS
ncbi:MAG: M20 family metallopeptidase [Candidatus Asgardarchaeia archaeon]